MTNSDKTSDLLTTAMIVETQDDADACFEQLVASLRESNETLDAESAEQVCRHAIGYHAGYYSHETRLRVERLFHCEHPILGAAKNGVPSPEQIFQIGLKLGEQIRDRHKQ